MEVTIKLPQRTNPRIGTRRQRSGYFCSAVHHADAGIGIEPAPIPETASG